MIAARRSATRRLGFTLIELLIAITIIGVIAGLAIGAFIRVLSVGTAASSKALVEQLHHGLMEKLEAFIADAQNTSPTEYHFFLAASPTTGDPNGTATTALPNTIHFRRAALIARLDQMRGDFPQQFGDFLRRDGDRPQISMPAQATDADNTWEGDLTVANPPVGEGLRSRGERSAMFMEFCRATNQNPTLNVGIPANHDPATESSECLYLILTTGRREGMTFDIDKVPPRFIRDTDNDGLKEFVDAWGKPLRFYRWPTDYIAYLTDIRRQIPSALASGNFTSNLDPEQLLTSETAWFASDKRRVMFEGGGYRFRNAGGAMANGNTTFFGGFFRLHQAYPAVLPNDLLTLSSSLETAQNDPTSAGGAYIGRHTSRVNDARAYSLMPLIVSAGPDQVFGLLDEDDVSDGGLRNQNRAPFAWEMHYRAGRISFRNYADSHDNIVSLNLVPAKSEE